jgi:hypothetical protein
MAMAPRSSLGLALGALLGRAAGACTDGTLRGGPGVTGGVTRIDIPMAVNSNIDVLFVIDDSPGMAPQRDKLLASYRRFMEVLALYPGGVPDLHIGVITADVGTRGPADLDPGPTIGAGPGSCTSDGDRGELRRAAAVTGSFISDLARPDGTRARNYTGSLADAFLQLADVGAAGCTYPRPLEAVRRALGDNPANAGFRREDAYLGVVLISNGDDCSFGTNLFTDGQLDRSRCTTSSGSLIPIDDYAAFLKTIVPDPLRIMALGAFEPPASSTCADASPAPRLAGFLDRFPNRDTLVSICEADLGPLMTGLGPLLKTTLGAPCLNPSPLDVDPATAGVQPDCAAWYGYRLDGALVEERIPPCVADQPGPCWRLSHDEVSCPSGELVDFRDQRLFGLFDEAHLVMECVSR